MFPFPYFSILVIFISCGSIKANPLSMLMDMINREYVKDACYIITCAYVEYEEVMKNFKGVREYCTADQGIRMRTLYGCRFFMNQPSSLDDSIDSVLIVMTETMDKFKKRTPTASKIVENIMYQSRHYEAYVGHDTMPSQVGQARDVCQHWNTVADLCYIQ